MNVALILVSLGIANGPLPPYINGKGTPRC